MNRIYKVLWNHAAQNWVVTSELARGNVKSSTSQLTNQLTAQPTEKKLYNSHTKCGHYCEFILYIGYG